MKAKKLLCVTSIISLLFSQSYLLGNTASANNTLNKKMVLKFM